MPNSDGFLESKRMKRSFAVALLIKTDSDWHRGVIRGIAQFAQDDGRWHFTVPNAEESGEVYLPKEWQGDGIICRLTSERLESQIQEREIPAVNVSWQYSHDRMPKVVSKESECARMIARYFIGKQYTNFGYIGFPPGSHYLPTIEATLKNEFNRVGSKLECLEISHDKSDSMGVNSDRLKKWLIQLPKPIAIVVWSSHVGYRVSMACQANDIEVPRDVAIVCIEHDSLWSELAPIPLSNLDQDPTRVGYAAAAQLGALMRGKVVPQRPVEVMPLSVVERLSSEATAVSDPVLKMALEYIYQHSREGITVKELTSILGVSRRSLESKFKRYLNSTPAAHIRMLQLQSVAKFLRNTNMSISEIAKRTGYDYPEVLMRTFKREYGLTPMQFRNSGLRSGDKHVFRPHVSHSSIRQP